MTAWRYLLDRIAAHPSRGEILSAMDIWTFTELWPDKDMPLKAQALATARQLATSRFDSEVAPALERMLDAADGLPGGDVLVPRELPEPHPRMAVWSPLLAGVNSTRH